MTLSQPTVPSLLPQSLLLSRRTSLLGMASLLLAGCVKKQGGKPDPIPKVTVDAKPNVPFGSRPHAFAPKMIFPSASEKERDEAVKNFYFKWKEKFLRPGCNPGELVVLTKNKPSQLTVSEAHGYGMIITAYMAGIEPDAKRQFDAFVRYHRSHPSGITQGIMAWNQNTACVDIGGKNGAIDGDLDIAYGLLLADKQWGSCHDVNYKAIAQWVITAISKKGIDQEGRYPLLGDWVNKQWTLSHYNGSRVSDFMGSHFRAFQEESSDVVWNGILDNTYWIANEIQTKHSPSGLLPDFVEGLDKGAPVPARMGYLEGARDGTYAYNACRIPLRMATDYMLSGDERPRHIALRINSFAKKVSGGDPKKLRGGYYLDGREMVDYETMAFTGPFAVGAMLDIEDQAWLDALWEHTVSREMENYYEDTLRLLSMIVLSGNWWGPEKLKSPCPEVAK
jgi:endoglucanase